MKSSSYKKLQCKVVEGLFERLWKAPIPSATIQHLTYRSVHPVGIPDFPRFVVRRNVGSTFGALWWETSTVGVGRLVVRLIFFSGFLYCWLSHLSRWRGVVCDGIESIRRIPLAAYARQLAPCDGEKSKRKAVKLRFYLRLPSDLKSGLWDSSPDSDHPCIPFIWRWICPR